MEVIVIESKAFEELVGKLEDKIEHLVIDKTCAKIELIVKDKMEEALIAIHNTRLENAKESLQKEYLTVDEVAVLLDCSPRTVFKYKKNGVIKFVKHEGKLKFRLSDVQEFLNSQEKHKGNNLPSIL